MKKEKNFSLLDQMNIDEDTTKESKELITNELNDFTKKEIKQFREYNEKVTDLDSIYTALKPRKSDVILRLLTKDFEQKKDDILSYSKVERLPIASGQGDHIVYDHFPNPYPFTKKAIVVSTPDRELDIKQGDIVSLKQKLQVTIGRQDKGVVTVAGGFIHPDYEEDYENMPQDPTDRHYGYVLLDEMEIELILKTK